MASRLLELGAFFVLATLLANAADYPCLGGRCNCDTVDEVAYCNNRGLLAFPDMDVRHGGILRAFKILSLRNNDISDHFPSEERVKRKFPNLKLIDLSNNGRLNCEAVERVFKSLAIMSHCSTNFTVDTPVGGHRVILVSPDGVPSTGDTICEPGFFCTLKKYYRKAEAWATVAWDDVKRKWEEVKRNRHVKNTTNFFKKIFGGG